MNLLFLNSIAPDVFGGIEAWTGLVATGLIERGHKVFVAGRAGSEFLRRTSLTCRRAKTIALRISGDFNPGTVMVIKRLLEQNDIHVIICNFNKDIRLGGLAARWQGSTRVVWGAGNNLTHNSAMHRYLTPRLLDGVITPSHDLKRQVVACGYLTADMITAIHIGIPGPKPALSREESRSQLRSKYALPQDCMIAVTSGRFVKPKGHACLIDAASTIVEQCPNLHFLLLGDGPLETEIRQTIAGDGLTEKFIFAGLLDDFELELAGADLMIHPSIIEPFGIVLLEAMRAGLPIAASRVGGIPEIILDGATGVLVEPNRPAELADAVVRLIGQDGAMSALGSAGYRRWQESFTVNRMVDSIEDYLNNIIGKGRTYEPIETA